MSANIYDEYEAISSKAVRKLLRDDPPGVQVLYDTLCGEMSFYTFRKDMGQYVSLVTDKQRLAVKEGANMSWRTIRRYLPILIERGLIRKRGNDVLQINPEFAFKGEGALRARACRHWHDTA